MMERHPRRADTAAASIFSGVLSVDGRRPIFASVARRGHVKRAEQSSHRWPTQPSRRTVPSRRRSRSSNLITRRSWSVSADSGSMGSSSCGSSLDRQ
jgi:hypothetical protein